MTHHAQRFLHADGAGSYSLPRLAAPKMNYIELLNRFDQMDTEQCFSASATRLYVKLLAECNRGRWQNPFVLSDRRLSFLLGGSVNTMKKARTELEERGLLAYQGGGNGAGDSCVYALQNGSPVAPLKVSKTDTLPANKVSDMVSISDTLLPNKVSDKVSEIDTINKEVNKDSSVVENKDTPNPSKVGVGASSQEKLLSPSQALTSGNSGGAALDEPQHQAARTLAAAIAQDWQISEAKNFQKWAKIFRFTILLTEAGQFDELASQFTAYAKYRQLRGISSYNLDKYLGSELHLSPQGWPYSNGEWCGYDWAAKLSEEQQTLANRAAARPTFGPAATSTTVAGNYVAAAQPKKIR